MSIDLTLWLVTSGMEVAVAAFLVKQRIYRLLPLFCLYIGWTILSDAGMFVIRRDYAPHYFHVYLFEISLDSILQFGVLSELAWSSLRPYRSVLPRGALAVIMALIVVVGAALWPVAHVAALPNLPPSWDFMVRVQQTFSFLRILFFLILAGSSQLLAIGWRDRELQVATGLGFYSIVSLGVALLHAQESSARHYHNLDTVVSMGYLLTLLYWTFSFSQSSVVRQEINPRVEMLLAQLAGAARSQRIALKSKEIDDPPGRNR